MYVTPVKEEARPSLTTIINYKEKHSIKFLHHAQIIKILDISLQTISFFLVMNWTRKLYGFDSDATAYYMRGSIRGKNVGYFT